MESSVPRVMESSVPRVMEFEEFKAHGAMLCPLKVICLNILA